MGKTLLAVGLVLAFMGSACETGNEAEPNRSRQELSQKLSEAQARAERLSNEREDLSGELGAAKERIRELKEAPTSELELPPGSGPLISLPYGGDIRARCKQARGISTQFSAASASISASYSAGGANDRRLVHPGDRLATPFGREQIHTWKLVYNHAPGRIETHVVLRSRVSRKTCFIRAFDLEQTITPH